jgi:predicted nucleic acid-binding protein
VAPITLGEIRAGYAIGGWGQARIAESEHRVGAYVVVPLDDATLNEYARLQAHYRKTGIGIGQNDLWIAAVAVSRGLPLVTCDLQQAQLPGVEAIYLSPPE